MTRFVAFALLLVLAASACAPLMLTRPVTKLGLVAPFEGAQRAIGYEALYAVKLALREQNTAGGTAGWLVELVALDQEADLNQALRQAAVLAADPDVSYVIGLAAPSDVQPIQARYGEIGLPLDVLVTPVVKGNEPDPGFDEHYRLISGGAPAGPMAWQVYGATKLALRRIAAKITATGHPER
jgi:ABC-type branched-subunit amino acid transport system substrate-binding protein